MKSHNIVYTNEEKLQAFIKIHKMEKEKNLLVQIFSSIIDKEYCLTLAKKTKELLPQAKIIGTTSSGEICNGKIYEKTVLSFSSFEKTQIKSKLYKLNSSFSLSAMQRDLLKNDTKAMIIFSDGLKSDAEKLLKEIHKMVPEVIIAGGRAADKNFKQTFVFTEDEYSENGCVIATLNSKDLIVSSDYILKWTPIGKEMTVTKAEGSTLYELDGIPVIEVYRKYLGDDVVKNLPSSCTAFPLLLHKEGVLIARDSVSLLKEKKALVYAGKFEIGDSVRFSFANIEELAENLYDYFKKIRTNAAEAVYIYSCAARKALLKEKLIDEINILESLAPTVGFFTFGEYFHQGKITEVLNVTTTFILLSESKKRKKEKKLLKIKTNDFDPIKKALIHLVKVTTKELENFSTHDSLTSLYNRSEYLRTIKRTIKSAQRHGNIFGLILVDIDFFKLVNDNYGHDIGDEVLKKLATILQKNIREDDFVARWGGEEFVIIVNYTDKQGLIHLARKLQNKIAETSFSPVPKITASFGLTVYKQEDDYKELFKRVDNALYIAKHNGRDQYILG